MRAMNQIKNLFPPFIAQTRKKTVWDTFKTIQRGKIVNITRK